MFFRDTRPCCTVLNVLQTDAPLCGTSQHAVCPVRLLSILLHLGERCNPPYVRELTFFKGGSKGMNGGVIPIAIKKMEWWRNKGRFVRRRIVCSYCNVNFVGYSAQSRLILCDRKLISRIRKVFSRF